MGQPPTFRFESSVTAPVRARARPRRLAPVLSVWVSAMNSSKPLDATLNLQLGEVASAPLVVRVDWADKRSAYQHNVSFPPAGVYPRRANLPTVNTWLSIRLARKRDALLKKLEGRWAKAFCAGPQFGPEEGARCLYGGGTRARAAVAAVTAVFGEDTETAVDQRVRRRVEKVAAEPDGDEKAPHPDEPAVEDATPASSESI